jgi:hypothetical protein
METLGDRLDDVIKWKCAFVQVTLALSFLILKSM